MEKKPTVRWSPAIDTWLRKCETPSSLSLFHFCPHDGNTICLSDVTFNTLSYTSSPFTLFINVRSQAHNPWVDQSLHTLDSLCSSHHPGDAVLAPVRNWVRLWWMDMPVADFGRKLESCLCLPGLNHGLDGVGRSVWGPSCDADYHVKKNIYFLSCSS